MHSQIDIEIAINAPAARVWQVFTDATLTRKLGGEYVSEWQVGSPLRWKSLAGAFFTDGRILAIEPARLLQHNLLDASGAVTSTITYELAESAEVTTLSAKEEFAAPIDDGAKSDALAGWQAALDAVKRVSEERDDSTHHH